VRVATEGVTLPTEGSGGSVVECEPTRPILGGVANGEGTLNDVAVVRESHCLTFVLVLYLVSLDYQTRESVSSLVGNGLVTIHDALGHGSEGSLPSSILLQGLNLCNHEGSVGDALLSLASRDDPHCLTFLI
jgi:hypothetical protein